MVGLIFVNAHSPVYNDSGEGMHLWIFQLLTFFFNFSNGNVARLLVLASPATTQLSPIGRKADHTSLLRGFILQ